MSARSGARVVSLRGSLTLGAALGVAAALGAAVTVAGAVGAGGALTSRCTAGAGRSRLRKAITTTPMAASNDKNAAGSAHRGTAVREEERFAPRGRAAGSPGFGEIAGFGAAERAGAEAGADGGDSAWGGDEACDGDGCDEACDGDGCDEACGGDDLGDGCDEACGGDDPGGGCVDGGFREGCAPPIASSIASTTAAALG
jgi:hypothetical protein